jgi:hypothetical protein
MARVAWARRHDPATEPDGSALAAVAPDQASAHPFELAAVDFTTVTGRWTGWIATDGNRTSDWLNHSSELVIRGMNEIALADDLDEPGLPVASGLTEHRLRPEELLFVVPPPLPPNRHLRLHRRRVRIHLDMGDYHISGELHVRPGANAGDYALRSSRTMIPLTEVELAYRGEPEFRRLESVLIVNARHVTHMRESEERGRPLATSSSAGPALSTIDTAPSVSSDGTIPRQRHGLVTRDSLAALRVLLDAGVLDVGEFQAKRAEILARPQA